MVKSLIVYDKANHSLNLHVTTELISKGSLKVSCFLFCFDIVSFNSGNNLVPLLVD